jgi:hypothetical protein
VRNPRCWIGLNPTFSIVGAVDSMHGLVVAATPTQDAGRALSVDPW